MALTDRKSIVKNEISSYSFTPEQLEILKIEYEEKLQQENTIYEQLIDEPERRYSTNPSDIITTRLRNSLDY